MTPLADQQIVPTNKGARPLGGAELTTLHAELGDAWEVVGGKTLRREFASPDFAQALSFVNRVGALAEDAGHHPDVQLSYGKVVIELSTHDVGGLTVNDFILAARIGAA